MSTNNKIDVSVLNKTGFPQLILYLYKNNSQEVNQDTVIYDLGPHNGQKGCASATIRKTLEYAEYRGFIKIEKKETFPFKHVICLTQLGLQVGQLLVSMDAVLKESSQKS